MLILTAWSYFLTVEREEYVVLITLYGDRKNVDHAITAFPEWTIILKHHDIDHLCILGWFSVTQIQLHRVFRVR